MTFVDTSAWFEAAAGHGEPAEAAREALRGAATELATSDAVLVELWNLLQRSGHVHLATLTCADIAQTTRMLPIDAAVRDRALEVQRAWYDQRFSYADALSFALIEHHEIAAAVSFDHHFRIFRAGPHRNRSLRVLPG